MQYALKASLLVIVLLIASCSCDRQEETAVKSYPERWIAKPGLGWHIQLQGDVVKYDDAAVYDLDLLDTDSSMVELLHSEGKKVICYFSAGTFEDWRSFAQNYPKNIIGNYVDGRDGESWLDIRDQEYLPKIIKIRLDLAVKKGCDAVDPSGLDGYKYETGFAITYDQQKDYMLFIADEAHKRGLAVGFRGNAEKANSFSEIFDFAIDDSCFKNGDCDLLYSFIQHDKPVYGVEYIFPPEVFCEAANSLNFDFVSSPVGLNGTDRIPCRRVIW
jgi:hypothetical protein